MLNRTYEVSESVRSGATPKATLGVTMNVFQVGSLPWLVRHKLKLVWRQLGQSPTAKVWLALLSILVVLGSLALIVTVLPALPDTALLREGIDRFKSSFVVSPIATGLVFCLFLLGGIAGGLKLFSSSTDLELLLASPIHNSVVVCSELLGLTIELSATPVLLFTPVVLLLLARGIWQATGGYIAILTVTAISASMGITLIYLSIRHLGFRTTRFLVQVFNGSIFIVYLFFSSLVGPFLGYVAEQIPGIRQLLPLVAIVPNLLVKAVFLDPIPTLACSGIATLSILAATRTISRTIVTTTTPIRDRSRSTVQPETANPHTFSDNLSWLLMVKEWRLLWRDNTIRASLILQVFAYGYFIHTLAQISAESSTASPVLISGITIAIGNGIASRFIRRMAIAEEASELLVSSPVPSATIKMSKLLAAWIPAICFAFPFTLIAIWQDIPWIAPLVMTGIATASTCVMGLWSARGVDNADLFNKGMERRQDSILQVLQSIHYMLWLILGGAAAGSGIVSIAIAAVAVGCLVPTIALTYARSYQLRKLAYF
ncbi:MAG: hypothetical protein AAF974_00400 [Cyanobacteria bacterium P01_E01_bin.34]